jgi:hypothetical protein
MARFLTRLLVAIVLAMVGFYAACLLGLVYMRYFPPLMAAVRLQRQAEALMGSGSLERRYHWRPQQMGWYQRITLQRMRQTGW